MLDVLRDIVQEVSATSDLAGALDIVVRRVKQSLDCDGCSVYLIDPNTTEYVLAATEGLNSAMVGKLRLKLGQGLIGVVGDREEPINTQDMFEHPRFINMPELGEEGFHGFLGVPMIHQRRLLGVLVIYQNEKRIFEENEQSFLLTLAAQLVGVIAHAQAVGASFLHNRIWRSKKKQKQTKCYHGIAASSGVAIGKAVVIYPPARLDLVPHRQVEDTAGELDRFRQATERVVKEIKQLKQSLTDFLTEENRAVFDVYIEILQSDSLVKDVEKRIQQGLWAPSALKEVVERYVAQFEKLDDEYIRERAADFRELGRRILSQLQTNQRTVPEYPENTILVGEQLTPTAMAEVPEGRLAGVISLEGSSNSHLSILARAMEIPTVVGLEIASLKGLDDREIIVDGYYGHVYVSPAKTVKKEFSRLQKEEQALAAELAGLRDLPAVTADGRTMELHVNTGLAADVSQSLQVGAHGVGLYRTEIPFMARDRFPTENEQRIAYRQLLHAFAPRPVTMRTLDIGGDKSLPYFNIDDRNPFLGWRGIRVTLDHPDIFLVQIKAMLRANYDMGNLKLLLPFLSTISELEEALQLIRQAHEEVREELPDMKDLPVGVMIEVPAAVYMAQAIASRVDFLSVGSNDLVQYILAVDRNNSRVAGLYESMHPAVLRALKQTVGAAQKERVPVSICGEMAGDPAATLLLLALGFNSLSMSATRLLRVKWVVRSFSRQYALQLLSEIWSLDDPLEIRRYMEATLVEHGLGGLVRAGK